MASAAGAARPRCPRPAARQTSPCRRRAPSAPRSTRRGRAGRPALRTVEARAAVAHEDGDGVVGDLGVDVDLLDPGELGGVRHRLARGEHERAGGVVDRAVARARDLDPHAVELLDLGCRGRERGDERGALVSERPVGVQPAAQLPLLAARERRHPARLRGMALDQRERLQNRIVHARGDLRALLAADPGGALGVALEREAPQPRPGDQQQRARDRAGREQRAACRHPRRAARPRRPPRGKPARRAAHPAGSRRPAPGERQAAGDQGDPATDRLERPSALRSSAPAPTASRRDPHAVSRAVRPEREVEEDPRSAREREQREDEPDERGVDGEGLRDPRADPGNHAVVSAAGTLGAACRRHRRGGRSRPTRPDMPGVDDEHAVPGRPGALVGIPAVVRRRRTVHVAEPARPYARTATPRGTTMSTSP